MQGAEVAELAASLLRSSDGVLEGRGEPVQEVRLAPLASPLPALRGKLLSLLEPLHQYFPGSSAGKESTCNTGDPGLIPGSGRSPGEGIGCPLQYSWASLVAQLVGNSPAMRRPGFDPWVGKIP